MLVTRVIGDCPGCGGSRTFGNVQVRGDHVLRGCTKCRFSVHVPLPPVRKKILYLDQFFFSNAFKKGDRRFLDAVALISELASSQLLAVPYSTAHEDETQQWRGYGGKTKDDLMKFIKSSARGHQFEAAYDVERDQLVRAFDAFRAARPATYSPQLEEAVEGRIHEWDDYVWIDVNSYMGDVELKRALKRQSVEQLVDLFPSWLVSTRTYDEDVGFELRGSAENYLRYYVEYVFRVGNGNYKAFFDAPIMSMVVDSLMHYDTKSPAEERLAKVKAFLGSEHFGQAPYQWISTRLFALLKQLVKHGAYKDRDEAIQRLSGFCDDVTHVSTYAPYCDAIVIDKAMGALVNDPRIDLSARYGARVFTLNNWSDFMEWLTALREQMPEEHKLALAEAYARQ
jgi:hypothetical protein